VEILVSQQSNKHQELDDYSSESLNIAVFDYSFSYGEKMSKTIENLKGAFAGESQANRRYLAFARKAEEEGLEQIAKLFRAAAEAETVHALNHLRIMGEVKSTTENLGTAVSGETFEFKTMYPEYLAKAKNEGNQQAVWSFDVANKVEQIHAGLFSKAIETLKIGKKPASVDYFVCGVCGNTVEGEAPEKCPICGAAKSKFLKIT
jgi:rubrerythrin